MHLSQISLAAVLSTAASFTVNPIGNLGVPHSRYNHRLSRSDQGWDNDNFLDALGGGQSNIDSANQKYQNESAKRSAIRDIRLQSMAKDEFGDPDTAALFGAKVPGMPDKPPKAPEVDEENPMGGQMFRKMMEKAQQGPSRPSSVAEAYPTDSSPAGPPPVAAAPQPVAATTGSAVDPMVYYQQQLVAWQQQMTAFAQLSAANPEAAAQMTMPPPPPPPPGLGAAPVQEQQPTIPTNPENLKPEDYVPKGSGNKDVYEIQNTADVYFAQLKRDSSVRQKARNDGDVNVANSVFADVGVKALNNYISPELLKQRREQVAAGGGEFETSRDEMIIPYADDEEEVDKSYTGISYKQKMLEMKKKKSGQKGARATTQAALEPEPIVESKPAVVLPVQTAPVVAAKPIPEMVEEPELIEKEEKESGEGQPNFALQVTEDLDDSPIRAPSMEDSEESRRSIRTLMGLVLKHRGGPGFGAGRLKEAEAQKLTDAISEVMALLKTEGADGSAPVPSTTPTSVSSNDLSSASSMQLEAAIACAEGALGLYKGSDASSKKELVGPVRDALASAIKVLSKEIDGSSPEMVSTALTPPAPAPVYATTMDFPDTYKVTKPEMDESNTTNTDEGTSPDENTEILQNAYDKLKAFAGDEKYGLREVAPNEVDHIKDILKDMRFVLMDELDNGMST